MPQDDVAARAARLHAESIVIDCHSDLLMPIADGYTRFADDPAPPDPALRLPVELPEGSRRRLDWPFGAPSCLGQYTLPKLIAGGLTTQVCAMFVEDHCLDRALERSLEMTWWMHREVEDNRDRVELVLTGGDIRRAKAAGKVGVMLAIEGFEPLGLDLRYLDIFYKLGVRMAGVAHNRRNAWSDGTQYYVQSGGLTKLGKQAVTRMNELGIVVDVGHHAVAGFWDTLEVTKAPVVLSHRSPRKFFPLRSEDSPFHGIYDLSRGRDRLEALAKNGGVFGSFFLDATDVEDVVDDIEHVFDLVGPDHVGFGSDLYGLEKAPRGLEDMSKTPAVTECMLRRGHSEEVIRKVLGGNFMRVFDAVLGK
jgi:membrane dipeptidase